MLTLPVTFLLWIPTCFIFGGYVAAVAYPFFVLVGAPLQLSVWRAARGGIREVASSFVAWGLALLVAGGCVFILQRWTFTGVSLWHGFSWNNIPLSAALGAPAGAVWVTCVLKRWSFIPGAVFGTLYVASFTLTHSWGEEAGFPSAIDGLLLGAGFLTPTLLLAPALGWLEGREDKLCNEHAGGRKVVVGFYVIAAVAFFLLYSLAGPDAVHKLWRSSEKWDVASPTPTLTTEYRYDIGAKSRGEEVFAVVGNRVHHLNLGTKQARTFGVIPRNFGVQLWGTNRFIVTTRHRIIVCNDRGREWSRRVPFNPLFYLENQNSELVMGGGFEVLCLDSRGGRRWATSLRHHGALAELFEAAELPDGRVIVLDFSGHAFLLSQQGAVLWNTATRMTDVAAFQFLPPNIIRISGRAEVVTISYDGQVIAREPARGIIGFHGNYQLRMENGHVYRTDSSGHTTLLSPGRQIKQCVLSQEKLLLREADKVLVMNISGEIVGQVLLTTPEMQVRCLAGNHVIAVSLGETRAVFAFPIEPLKTSSGVKVGSL